MSPSEVWAEDSDSDSDPEARQKRIAHMEQQYRNGQTLYIMSASLKGELLQNPWSRKRKRAGPQNVISTYFPAKKVVPSQSKHTPLKPSTSASSRAQTPVWDRELTARLGKIVEKSTARVIDFRQYDSQAPDRLIEKAVHDVDTIEAPMSAPRTEESRRRSSSDQVVATKRPSEKDGTHVILISGSSESAGEEHANAEKHVHHPKDHTPNSSPEVNTIVAKDQLAAASILEVYPDNEDAHSDSTLSSDPDSQPVLDSSGLFRTNGSGHADSASDDLSDVDVPMRLSPQHLILAKPQVEKYPDEDPIINTQSELASAQKGLALALQLTTHNDDLLQVQMTEHRVEPIQELLHAPSSVEDAPRHASRTMNQPRETPSAIPHTPPRRAKSPRQSFAAFESPSNTSNSPFGVGSPLTFSPERANGSTNAEHGHRAIDDIHKYLLETSFDVEHEARLLRRQQSSPAAAS